MREFLRMTFGGLSAQYFLRQLFFGTLLALFFLWVAARGVTPVSAGMIVFFTVSTLLYPYSRFVYEQIVGFIVGDNVFFANAVFALMLKFTTMAMCWAFSIFVSPIGLLWLYFYHRRAA